MAKRKNPMAVALGRRGGKAAAGSGGRKYWSDISPEERSRMMRERVKKRWSKTKKKTT